MTKMLQTEGIDHVALTVSDLSASVEWYGRILGLTRRYEVWDVPAMMGAGTTAVALFAGAGPEPQETTSPDLGFRHLAFRVTRANFELTKSLLESETIPYRGADHGISHSIYFSDPDGNELEITTYELES